MRFYGSGRMRREVVMISAIKRDNGEEADASRVLLNEVTSWNLIDWCARKQIKLGKF
jgi:hypothetical protein